MIHSALKSILVAGDNLIVMDVGAKGGPQELIGLDSLLQVHCFEPNPSEVDGIGRSVTDSIKKTTEPTTVYPFALCGSSGSVTLNVSVRPGSTSTLEPNKELLSRFAADNFSQMQELVKRIEVPAVSMHDFMSKAELGWIDFIKLDTQGNELEILKSAGDYIDSVSVIMTEVEMIPLYKNQPLFHDVSQFLCSRGFELIDLRSNPTCRRFHSRADLPPSAYRLVWGDAIYVRRPHEASKPRALHQGLVLAGMGYADLAIDLFNRNPLLSEKQKTELEAFSRWAAEPHWLTGRIKRVIERAFGLLISRYHWRQGHQVASRKTNHS